MKTLIQICFFWILSIIITFSQNGIYREIKTEKPAAEKSAYDKIISKTHDEFYKKSGYEEKDTRTNIKKTLLDNVLIEEIRQDWDGSNWVNYWKYSYTYDGNNNLIEDLYQWWDDPNWVNGHKNSYTYDGNNNRTEYLNQIWDGSNWVNSSKNSYTYDGNNNLTEELCQAWQGSWVNYYKYSYTYDGNNNQTEWLYQESLDGKWVNYLKYSYTYDGNNNQTEEFEQVWDGSNWVIARKFSYTYDGNNNRTEWLNQYWDGSNWVNDVKFSYTYDGNNNQTEWLFQAWEGSWVNYYKYSYTYDGNNNQTEELYQSWDGSNWVNENKILFVYGPATAINEEYNNIIAYSLSNNYPNPYNPSTKIDYAIPERSNVRIQVFNVLGGEVAELVNGEKEAGEYSIEFNAANLPSGVYFYQLRAGSFVETRKMLLMK